MVKGSAFLYARREVQPLVEVARQALLAVLRGDPLGVLHVIPHQVLAAQQAHLLDHVLERLAQRRHARVALGDVLLEHPAHDARDLLGDQRVERGHVRRLDGED